MKFVRRYKKWIDYGILILFSVLTFTWLKLFFNTGKKAGLWLGILFGITAGIKLSEILSARRTEKKN